jgi:hypothetical protein
VRVELDNGEVIELGATEETPTIGITDYSRRVTDDFGVTTVVPRNFARRMSVRLLMPTDDVDALQIRLAALRATPAHWIADERFAWLGFRGFYKEFEIDLAVPPASFCTLTIDGLAAAEPFDDPGGDPAPAGSVSTLQLLQPAEIAGPALIASSVDESDYPEWDGGLAYPLGARVIKGGAHRIYESAADANQGNDPLGVSGKWTDIGPTNRWAMFDQALGSVTTANGSIVVEVQNGTIDALALLDVAAESVRVQIANSYDQTKEPNAGGSVTFLDIPSTTDSAVVTITGAGAVSVGTLMIGNLVALGNTEASPTAGITDYSKKDIDDFGEVTIVERAWAKRMSAKALIDTAAIDTVAGRIAAVRARPALWIADGELDALTVFGFFKDFSIEVGSAVSKLSLSIEGLSTAGKVEPLGAMVNWPDIADPDGTKPEDNATVGAPGNSPVGSSTGNQVSDGLAAVQELTSGLLATIGEIPEGATVAQEIQRVAAAEIGGNLLSNSDFASGKVNGLVPGWGLVSETPASFFWGVDNAGFVVPGEHYQGLLCLEPNGDRSAALVSDWVAVQAGQWLQISAWLAARECVARIRMQWGDGAGNFLQEGAQSDRVGPPFTGASSLDAFSRLWCKQQVPAGIGATSVRFVLDKGPYLANEAGNLSWAFMLRPMLALASAEQTVPSNYRPVGGGAGLSSATAQIEDNRLAAASDTNAVAERVETVEAKFAPGGVVPTAVARIEEVSQAAAADNQAVAQRATNLEASVGGPGGLMARTSVVENVAADAYSRVAGASLTLAAMAGDGRAEVAIFAYTQDGQVISGIRLTGDVEIVGNLLVSESITTGKLAPNAASSINYFFSSTASATSATTDWTDLYMGGARVQVASSVPDTGGIILLDVFYSSGTQEGSIGWAAAARIVRHDGKVFVPAQELGGQVALRVIDEAPIANAVNTYVLQTAKEFYTGGQAEDIHMYNALLTADLRKR